MTHKYASTLEHLSGIQVPEHVARKVFAVREIRTRKTIRANTAKTLRAIRTEWRQQFGSGKGEQLRNLCHHIINNSRNGSISPNPTIRNLKTEAGRLIAFSRTPIPDLSTEYYSACGAEDAAGERRDHAREQGKLLLIAAKYLRAGSGPCPLQARAVPA